jgi:hypothetical protein
VRGVRARAAGLTTAALLLAGCGGATGSHPADSTGGSSTTSAVVSSATVTQTATGSGKASTSGGSQTTTSGRRHTHSSPTTSVRGPRVGTRQSVHVGGTDLTVTMLRVLDLARAGSSVPRSAMLPGTRPVGVELRIANQSGPTYDSTSSGDVSVVLSHGDGEPLQIRAGVCETPLVDFESMLSAGTVRSGCVAFSVPRAARVIGVRFSPHSRAPGTLTWRVG